MLDSEVSDWEMLIVWYKQALAGQKRWLAVLSGVNMLVGS